MLETHELEEHCPLGRDELIDLACADDTRSRLIREAGGTEPWELRHGPFEPDDFAPLPDSGWTLLVQQVDTLDPAVEALRERFAFLPRWRLDDVMVSYAPQAEASHLLWHLLAVLVVGRPAISLVGWLIIK